MASGRATDVPEALHDTRPIQVYTAERAACLVGGKDAAATGRFSLRPSTAYGMGDCQVREVFPVFPEELSS